MIILWRQCEILEGRHITCFSSYLWNMLWDGRELAHSAWSSVSRKILGLFVSTQNVRACMDFFFRDKSCRIYPSFSCDGIMWMEGSGRCDICFNISKAFHVIRGGILISQGNKSTMMCQQSWLKRHPPRVVRTLLAKRQHLSSVFCIRTLLDQTLQPQETNP